MLERLGIGERLEVFHRPAVNYLAHRQLDELAASGARDVGDLYHGFARIYCDACGHDYLLAYSCKTRHFCPSCHQKRGLLYGETGTVI